MNIKSKFLFVIALGASLFFASCEKESTDDDDNTGGVTTEAGYSEGVLISNEGSFGAGNGSISYFDTDSNTVTNELFKTVNNFPLGDIVQSVYRGTKNTYACVNASNKIEVFNSTTFMSVATVSNVPLPRYAVENNGKLYVSCWGNNGQIKVIDISSNTIVDSIMVGTGPEGLIVSDNKLFVANSGGFTGDSTISIVNLTNNTVETLQLNAHNPASFVKDSNDKLWVLAKGNVIYDAAWNPIGHNPSKLVSINPADNTIATTIDLFADQHPSVIGISKNKQVIYYGGGYGFNGIYAFDYTLPSAPVASLIDGDFYGFLINSKNDEIFALAAPMGATGVLTRYTAAVVKIDENNVGIFPNGGVSKRMRK